MADYKLLHGDCLDKLKELEDNSIDAVVTDPPYGLSFMGKKWDYDVPKQEVWEECMRVLKPGGHLLAFAGSRTYHRMAVRVEDAGFEIRDQIMWLYGSGFPKSHNIGKAVDALTKTGKSNPKALREVRMGDDYEPTGQKDYKKGRMFSSEIENDNTNQLIENEWEGWGTALKPAHEPIVMARKPIKGTVAQNVLEHGVGGLNIDGCRVQYQNGFENEFSETYLKSGHSKEDDGGDVLNISGGKRNGVYVNTEGRFPANIILDEEAGKILDQQSGTTKSNKRSPKNNKKTEGTLTYTPPQAIYNDNNTHADEGGASRFFYCPKVSKKERDEGLQGEEKIIKGRDEGQDKTSIAYKARPSERKNIHPTVKPSALMEYLIRLVTPKGGVVLDPFMGSGSTGKACAREGMSFVGIEMDDEYIDIAKQRVEYEYDKRKFF